MEKDPARELLRHTVATLAYSGGKAIRGAPDGFEALKVEEKTKTPGAILAHIGDLLDRALSMAEGKGRLGSGLDFLLCGPCSPAAPICPSRVPLCSCASFS